MDTKPLPPGFQAQKIQPLELPNPSSFRQLRPAILGTPPVSLKTRLFERRRVIIGLAIAAALHVTLGLAWWLTPPLRLKAGIDPKRWVQVVSLPQHAPAASPPAQPRAPHDAARGAPATRPPPPAVAP